jgi:hypothetical protein
VYGDPRGEDSGSRIWYSTRAFDTWSARAKKVHSRRANPGFDGVVYDALRHPVDLGINEGVGPANRLLCQALLLMLKPWRLCVGVNGIKTASIPLG